MVEGQPEPVSPAMPSDASLDDPLQTQAAQVLAELGEPRAEDPQSPQDSVARVEQVASPGGERKRRRSSSDSSSRSLESSRSRSSSRSPYRCSFCDEQLKTETPEDFDLLCLIRVIDQCVCPHCYTRYRRPAAWYGRWPIVQRIFSFERATKSGPTVVDQHRADCDDHSGRRLLRIGKWVERKEKAIWKSVAAVTGWIWLRIRKPFVRNAAQESSRKRRSEFKPYRHLSQRRGLGWMLLRWIIGTPKR